MADSTQTVAPAWGGDNFKKRVIIYKRAENDKSIAKCPDIKNLSTGDRSAIVFDTVNRNVVCHAKGDANTEDTVLAGHTYTGVSGKHNEIFNDYGGNRPNDDVSYSFICGRGNKSYYNNSDTDGGSFVCGHFNNPDSSYIMCVGNGKNDNARSNIMVLTAEGAMSVGDATNGTVEIGHGKIFISGDAYIGPSRVSLTEFMDKLDTVYKLLQNETIIIK